MSDAAAGDFTIARGDAGQRLDAFLAARLGCSRGRVQQGIEAGDVVVNGRRARSSYKLRAGDAVEAELHDLHAGAEAALVPEDIPLIILHEDDDLAVVHKPALMVVHPAGDITRGCSSG